MNPFDPADYNRISDKRIETFTKSLSPLMGLQLPVLQLPKNTLIGFEPSQIGTLVGTLMDACIPQLSDLLPDHDFLGEIGLAKHEGILGEREGYPDYRHSSGVRAELKLLYVDPYDISMKSPPTPREASARVTQKVTLKNIEPENDVLLVIAYQLQSIPPRPAIISPKIIDYGVFPMIDCVLARDKRLIDGGGKWFGDYETPAILSLVGKKKIKAGKPVETTTYGRKASEGRDFNEDTNFGKLKRIPYKPLQLLLKKHGATYTRTGTYPKRWQIKRTENTPGFSEDN